MKYRETSQSSGLLNFETSVCVFDPESDVYQESYVSLGEQIRQAHFDGVPLQTTSQIYGYDDDNNIDPIADVRVSRLDLEESQLSKAQWNAMQEDYASKAKSYRDKVKASADDLVKSMSNDESGA